MASLRNIMYMSEITKRTLIHSACGSRFFSLSLSCISLCLPLSITVQTHQPVSLSSVQISGNHSQLSCLDGWMSGRETAGRQTGKRAEGIPNKEFLDRFILPLGRPPEVFFHTKPCTEVLSVNSECQGGCRRPGPVVGSMA